MLRISYVKKTCPQCGDVYKICKSKTQTSVGSLITNCKNVDIMLLIVAVILKIFYIQKYGMIIIEVNANCIKILS